MNTFGSNARTSRALPQANHYVEAAHAASEFDDSFDMDDDRDPFRAARGIVFTTLAVLNIGLLVAFLT